MNDNLANFNSWFKEPILRLQQDSETGFITVMISLALLERYLREKSRLPEGERINASFRAELVKLFPSIGSDDAAQKFWAVCRHGLMHQVTFKTTFGGKNITMGLHESAPVIQHSYEGSGDVFMISPTKFSNRIIEVIESDFATFQAPSSPNHPLSQVSSITGHSGYSGSKH
jgi:hypothetical protein